jgi:hypothetical protein
MKMKLLVLWVLRSRVELLTKNSIKGRAQCQCRLAPFSDGD